MTDHDQFRKRRWEQAAREAVAGRVAAARFPYPLVETPGARALQTWRELKGRGEGVPVVLGGPGALARVADGVQRGRKRGETPKELLKTAERLRFPEDLVLQREKERKKAEAFMRRRLKHPPPPDPKDEEARPRVGPWPEEAPTAETPLSVSLEIDWKNLKAGEPARLIPFATVYIALLPAADATEAPAYLHWGDWNDVPPSALLVAALRSWRDRYGAELAGMSADVWNLLAARRPQERDEALALAREMAELCPDALGEGTLQELAASLMACDWWHFWWD